MTNKKIVSKEIHLKRRPTGFVTEEDFGLVEVEVPEPKREGEFLVCTELGITGLKCAVVGALAVSLSAYCARAGFDCEVHVPRGNEWKLTPSRLYRLISYGAKISFVPNSFTLSSSDCYFVKTSNMIFVEGLKTTGFEICDQLLWELPDHIIVPVGSGSNLYAISQSISESIQLGLVKKHTNGKGQKYPKIHGVTVGFPATASLMSSNLKRVNTDTYTEIRYGHEDQSADRLSIAPELISSSPIHLEHAISAINNSGGSMINVLNNDLINAVSLLASYDDIFASPTSAAAVAGVLKLSEHAAIEKDESVVCVVGGGELSNTRGVLIPRKTGKF